MMEGAHIAERVACPGSGNYPAESVILDTVPGMNPSGTCRVCGQRFTLTPFRLPEHPAHNDGSEGDQ